jgi:DNA-binding transcriptional regulator YbjK
MKADGCLSRRRTRDALDAAVRIVAEFGANALTHRAVAKSAQVSLTSVTYHFPARRSAALPTNTRALASGKS